jgi:serine/threonine-protein kinase
LGCTIYAMLTGAAPFDGGDTAEILQRHRDDSPALLRERRPDVGLELEALVSQLLAKRPDARPGSAVEVKARLEAIQQDPATIAISRPAPTPITARLATRAPAPEQDGLRHRVSARAAVRRAGDRRRAVSRGLAAVGALVVLSPAVALIAAKASAAPERLRVVWGTMLTPTPDVTPPPDPQDSAQTSSVQLNQSQSDESVVLVSTTPPDPIANLRLAIQQQVSTGQLSPDKASDLLTRVNGIAQAINAGNTGDARHRIQDFHNRITTLLTAGQLTAAGADVLTRDLDAILPP